MERRADHALQLAAISLPIALRKGDILVVDDIAKAIMADDAIVYLTVREQNIVIFRETRERYEDKDYAYFNTSPQFIVKQKKLYFSDITTKNQHVGSITLVVSRASVRNEVIANVLGIVGLTIAIIVVIALTSVFITRRYISSPLSKLQHSAALIAAGDLEVPVDKSSSDEIGSLAQDLDAMRGSIKEARGNLEQKVEVRTRDLTEALEQQTAISDVLKVMSRSTSDLQPVLETLIENATKLCRADHGIIFRSDGKVFRLAAAHGSAPPAWLDLVEKNPISPGRGTIVGRVALEKQIIHVPDVLVDPEYQWAESQKLGRFRTVLGVPLLRQGIPIGIIFIAKEKVQPFTGKQVELIATFADQALIAIENVRLFQELEARNRDVTESLEQQTATSEVLRVISSSPTDTQPVFDMIAESAARLCQGRFCVVSQFDGELLHLVSHFGLKGPALQAYQKGYPRPARADSAVGRAILNHKIAHIPDVEVDSNYRFIDVARIVTYRSIVAVPILRDSSPIGAIAVSRSVAEPFPDKQIELLETFADQAVIAIENVRLFQELQERNQEVTDALEQQTATSEVLRVIASSPTELQPVLEVVAESAAHLCGATDAEIFRVDGDKLRLVAKYGSIPMWSIGDDRSINRNWVSGRAVADRQTIHVDDLSAAEIDFPEGAAYSKQYGHRTTLATPLLREGTAIGVILIRREQVRPFTDKQIALLKTFADQAVIAIENVRLFQELEARTSDLTHSVEELKALSEVSQAVSSSLDLQSVLTNIVRHATRLSKTEAGTIYEFDEAENVFIPRVNYGLSAEFIEALRDSRLHVGDGTVVGQAALKQTPDQVPDLVKAPDYRLPCVQEAGFRALLAVPLMREDRVIGMLVVRRKAAGEFPEATVNLLQTLAAQSVTAILNARLFQEIQVKSQQVAEANSAMDAVLRTIEYGVLFLDSELRVRLCNRAYREMWRAPEELVNTNPTFHELMEYLRRNGAYAVSDEGWEEYRIARIKAIKKGDLAPVELNLADGKVLQYQVLALRDGGRMLTYFDITELKRREAQLAELVGKLEVASQHKSQFVANMSHELRTPLNAIIGYSEMLQEEAQDLGQEDFLPDLQKIHVAGKHLLDLINDILDLSKIEAGKMELFLESFDVPTLVRDVVATVQPLVEKNANTLQVDCADDVGEMHADLTKVRQALFNLLSNACKFTKRGTITLDVSKKAVDGSPWLRFRITDTGIGMTPEQMEKLFQAFSQADASTTRQFGGTGLGLAISRMFCQLMGGNIAVESTFGKGSTFTIQLPIEVTDHKVLQATAVEEVPQRALPVPDDTPTVLVIDDDPAVRDLMQRFLNKESLHMVAAADGREGLRLAKTLRPDAITLDVLMPGMNGWSVLTALKADPTLADIPVIMITIVDEKHVGYALGATDYLTKPIDWKRLTAIMQKYQRPNTATHVLIVEDDAHTRKMLRTRLEKQGWPVIEAENGRVALERMAERLPDLILLDLMMPEMDGFQFLDHVRAREDWRSIPIIVVTAKDLTKDDRRRLNGYVWEVLQKGAYSPEELLREVCSLVRARVEPRQTSVEEAV